MQRHRVLIAFGVAWLAALFLSWWVYRTSTAPVQRDVVSAVAAAKDLPIGKRIEKADLKLVTLDRKDLPKGAFLKAEELLDRAVSVQISASEPILATKVVARGSGEGITALIEPGTRAISVQVNEISGVSGFVQPGTRVDVLFTRVFTNGDAATTTILQNIKVIAYGRQFDPAVRVDPRDTSRPTVATLLVTQDQAEKLVLAMQRGKIQLVLRNALDEEVNEDYIPPTQSVDLGIDEPRRPVPAPPPPPPPPPPQPGAPGSTERVVRIYRGDKVTEQVLE